MTYYSFTQKPNNGEIRFYASEEEIMKQVVDYIRNLIDAENYRRTVHQVCMPKEDEE